MTKQRKLAFFVQARVGSSRLPGKTLLPFYNNFSIVQLILFRLLDQFPDVPVYLLTTQNPADDALLATITDSRIGIYRGEENNVLKRFTDAAAFFEVDDVIRVCADNPFLLPEFIAELLKNEEAAYDYSSFAFQGIPVMKCHFGVFAERVKREALEKALELAPNDFYREHVTNFIYEHPEQFRIHLKDKTPQLLPLDSLRLTIDTQDDFSNVSAIYQWVAENRSVNLQSLEEIRNRFPKEVEKMRNQISINKK